MWFRVFNFVLLSHLASVHLHQRQLATAVGGFRIEVNFSIAFGSGSRCTS
jgi:hypothetical protein